MATNITPLRDYIVIKPISEEKITPSGIIIPDSVKGKKPQEGEVLHVGLGRFDDNGKRVPMEVKVGDKVIFSDLYDNDIQLDGEDYLILNESNIKAIIS